MYNIYMDQKNSEYGHFSHSVELCQISMAELFYEK